MAQSLFNQQATMYLQRVNLMYQRPEIKASLEIILSVFTVAILIFFAIRPTITNIFSLQKKIEDSLVLEKKVDNKITQLISAQKQISENPDSISLINQSVPDYFDYFNYAKRLDIIARKNNVTLSNVSFPGEFMDGPVNLSKVPKEKAKSYTVPDKDGLFTMKTSFTILGDQADVFGFLTDVENMDRVSLIESIDITKTQKSVTDVKQTLSVLGQIYFYALNVNK